MHPGELSVIQLAKKLKIDIIIVDDNAALNVAKYFGLKPISTPYLLTMAVKSKILNKEDFKSALEKLISFNYYLSPTLYNKILKVVEKFE